MTSKEDKRTQNLLKVLEELSDQILIRKEELQTQYDTRRRIWYELHKSGHSKAELARASKTTDVNVGIGIALEKKREGIEEKA